MARPSLKVITTSYIAQADQLAKQHEDYTEQYVTRANDELYKLLAGMLALCMEIESSSNSEKIIKQLRKKLREDYGIKTQNNSPVASIVVRYVVRASRKTAHVYGRVIKAAMQDKIAPAQLPDYIRNNGGVDKLRKSVMQAQSEQKAKQQAFNERVFTNLAFALERNKRLGTVKFSDEKYEPKAGACDVAFHYLVCTDGKDGLEVVASLYPSSLLEQQAMDVYSTCLVAAACSDGDGDFYQTCKDTGLNMDMVHRWMKSNGFETGAAAKAFAHKVRDAMKVEAELRAKADAEHELKRHAVKLAA